MRRERVRISKRFVDTVRFNPQHEFHWDADLTGFGLRVQPSGAKSFVFRYRAGKGRSAPTRRITLGAVGTLTAEKAREKAQKLSGAVKLGGDPADPAAWENTLKAVCENYFKRECGMRLDPEGGATFEGKLRSASRRRAMLERLVYPRLGSRPIADVRRSDVARLLDAIEENHGPSMADQVLAVVRRIMGWHASRTDDYRSPIVRGMARTSPKERARTRTLTDDELRAVWATADKLKTPFARLVQFLLLTGVRRAEAAQMDRSEMADDEWTIPAARVKGKRDFLVPLTPAALAVLAELPVIGEADKGPVFTHGGKRPLGGFTKLKADFDKACGVTGWTIHDLRRTARTLMSRAGVDKDHAERALGHVIGGVRGVYDRHEFAAEKRQALEALAALIERIRNPRENVVDLKAAGVA
jgi:integrase